MQDVFCPLCYSELEVRDVAPCDDCGAQPSEIEHFSEGMHTYDVYTLFGSLRLTLCNVCACEFGEMEAKFFGLPGNRRIGRRLLQRVRALEQPMIVKDKYCPQCHFRLAFLRFIVQARAQQAQ
jgi:hypothetical protein